MRPRGPRRYGLLALAVAALLGAGACTSGSHDGTHDAGDHTPSPAPSSAAAGGHVDGRTDPATYAGPLDLRDCTSMIESLISNVPADRTFTFGCGYLTVPLNWADTHGKTVRLLVVRARLAGQHDRLGSLVINPGGPGGAGTDAAVNLAYSLPLDVLERFDLVGFDPRGVGGSSPLDCISDQEIDEQIAAPARITTQRQLDAVVAIKNKIAQDCDRKYGASLTYYSTAQTVRDLDALRARLGDAKLTYLGYSYGTLLGAEYASAYPGHVRALVLDGAVDPTVSDLQSAQAQTAGFALAFSHYAANCEAQKACPAGPDPKQRVLDLMAAAAKNPIPTSKSGDDRKATDGNVQLAVVSAMYTESSWPVLSKAIADAEHGDAKGIFALDDEYSERDASGHHTNLFDANTVISCADDADRTATPGGASAAPKLPPDATKPQKYPIFGDPSPELVADTGCSRWPAPPDQPITVRDAGSPPLLVIGTTGDPATPIAWARHLTQLLGTATLLTWDGEGHTAYPTPGCVDNAVNAYLIDLAVPAAGTVCRPG